MRLILRVYTYKSCCNDSYSDNANIAIPDWIHPAATTYPGPANGPTSGMAPMLPNWNEADYLDAFAQVLGALGRR
jgi:hypothetical protein